MLNSSHRKCSKKVREKWKKYWKSQGILSLEKIGTLFYCTRKEMTKKSVSSDLRFKYLHDLPVNQQNNILDISLIVPTSDTDPTRGWQSRHDKREDRMRSHEESVRATQHTD